MIPLDNGRAVRDASWLREVLEAEEQIAGRLSKVGIDDVSGIETIILATVSTGADVQVMADLMSDLKITDRAMAEAFNRLITAGYLERRSGQSAPGRGMIDVTRRGRDAYGTIMFTTVVRRWMDLPLRQGDIIVSSVPKSGTTWVQMICALLIFQTPDLPAPLAELSVWPEGELAVRDEMLAQLAAQQHRRFMKSHEPLNTIPADPRVTYIVVARHPLDAAISFYFQRNFDDERRRGHAGRSQASEALSARLALLQWVDMESHPPGQPSHYSLPGVMGHLGEAWARRGEPNVVLLRYEDLSADLAGQMRGLALRLGIAVPEETWPELVKAATFEQMREAADRIQPIIGLTDPKKFFRNGRPGSGQELLTGAELAHYHERAARLAPPDMLAWLHAPSGPVR